MTEFHYFVILVEWLAKQEPIQMCKLATKSPKCNLHISLYPFLSSSTMKRRRKTRKQFVASDA